MKRAGKNFLIVRAFVGDSTMISGLLKRSSFLKRTGLGPGPLKNRPKYTLGVKRVSSECPGCGRVTGQGFRLQACRRSAIWPIPAILLEFEDGPARTACGTAGPHRCGRARGRGRANGRGPPGTRFGHRFSASKRAVFGEYRRYLKQLRDRKLAQWPVDVVGCNQRR